MWGALSDERTCLSFTISAGPRSIVFLGSESLGTRDHILLSQIWDFPFRRLLRLAGLRWRYSTPPPHELWPTPLRMNPGRQNIGHHLKRFLCYSVLSVGAETSEPLPSKWTSASVAIPAFRRCLPNRCLANGHILSQYDTLAGFINFLVPVSE
jgi:hypothetical protein